MTSPAGRKDLELVQRAISEHHAFVYRLAYRMLRNQADAEDLTQTVFVELVRSPGALARVASPRAWLARVTFSKVASAKRGESRRRKREENWAKDRPATAAGDEMNTNDDVTEAIASLPDELRVPVVLHYQEGLKYREIAEVCQCAEGTIASRISTAKEKLREKLKPGSALAGFASVEAALQAEGAVALPPGLEARLLEGVARELALAGGAQTAGSAAKGLGAFTGGTAFTVGAAFVLAGAIMTGGWLGVRGALERDEAGSEATAAAASATRHGDDAEAEKASGVEAAPAVARRGGETAGGIDSEDEPAAGEENGDRASGSPGAPVVLGWVRDGRGRPLEGVTVGIIPPGGDAPARTATTDADGYYEFDGVAPVKEVLADQTLRLWRSYSDEAFSGAILALDEEQKNLELAALVEQRAKRAAMEATRMKLIESLAHTAAVAPPTASGYLAVSKRPSACPEPKVTGTCSSCHAETIDQAQIAAVEYEYTRAVEASAWLMKVHDVAAEGLVLAGAGAARYTVVAQLDGYRVEVSDPFEVKEGEPVEVELILQATPAITGTVFGTDGSHIADAEVAVIGHGGDRLLPASAAKTRTDSDGAFLLASLPAGVYAIRVSAPGFEPVESVASTGGHAPFVLPFTGSARVTVVQSETGEVRSGYKVELRQGRWLVAQAVTGEDGVAQLADVPPGDYVANTYHENSTSRQSRASGEITVLARRESALRLEVAKKVKAAGHVSLRDPAASPAAYSVRATRLDDSGEVDASPKTVAVAGDGYFEWKSGLAAGSYIVELFSGEKGSGAVVGSMDLEVVAGRPMEDLLVAEGATRTEALVERREDARAVAAPQSSPFEPIPVDDRTVTIQEPMKLRTLISLLAAAGAASITPGAEVEASGVLDHAKVETAGTSGFQALLRGALEPQGLRWAVSGSRVAIETAAKASR
jgi:RNA polymerase sigma-70 factor (ECF subfamily)